MGKEVKIHSHYFHSTLRMEQTSQQIHEGSETAVHQGAIKAVHQGAVSAVQTIPDLSPDGLAMVLFFMCFILLVLFVDLLLKMVPKWR